MRGPQLRPRILSPRFIGLGAHHMMAPSDTLDRRARRCLTGDGADDEGDINDSVFDEYDSAFATHGQGFAQSCSQGRRRCFDGFSPIEDDGFSDDDEMNSASDLGMLKQRRREVS